MRRPLVKSVKDISLLLSGLTSRNFIFPLPHTIVMSSSKRPGGASIDVVLSCSFGTISHRATASRCFLLLFFERIKKPWFLNQNQGFITQVLHPKDRISNLQKLDSSRESPLLGKRDPIHALLLLGYLSRE